MSLALTDDLAHEIVSMKKAINEVMRWQWDKQRRDARTMRGLVLPLQQSEADWQLNLFAESYLSRRGTLKWGIGLTLSGVRANLIRIDHHGDHANPDKTIISGCMMHLWCEAHEDRVAESVKDIVDCRTVDTALPGFLRITNIRLDTPVQSMWEGASNG